MGSASARKTCRTSLSHTSAVAAPKTALRMAVALGSRLLGVSSSFTVERYKPEATGRDSGASSPCAFPDLPSLRAEWLDLEESGRRWVSEMLRPLDEIDYLMGRPDRQRMLSESRPRKDVGGEFSREVELLFRCQREERDHHVLQCDDADAKMHQLGVRQLGDRGQLGARK